MPGFRSLSVSLAFALVLLAAPSARTESSGVPFIEGTWTGVWKSKYWDQTVEGSVRPRDKFKSDVTVTIVQDDQSGDLEATITFDDNPLPLHGVSLQSLGVVGNVGNFHLNLSEEEGAPELAASGVVNSKASKLKLEGVLATGEYTYEFVIGLKRRSD